MAGGMHSSIREVAKYDIDLHRCRRIESDGEDRGMIASDVHQKTITMDRGPYIEERGYVATRLGGLWPCLFIGEVFAKTFEDVVGTVMAGISGFGEPSLCEGGPDSVEGSGREFGHARHPGKCAIRVSRYRFTFYAGNLSSARCW
jgi:hypothetical protein